MERTSQRKGRIRLITAVVGWLGVLWSGSLLQGQDRESTYRLKPNDSISLTVFGEPDMSREVRLTVTGEGSLPLIGAVKLAGMSLKEAETTVSDLYRGDYLVEPKISINLLNAADERVIVMGAVNTPGPIGIPPNTSLDLVSAIDSAGGLASHADAGRVELKRGETVENYDLGVLRKKGASQVMLRHGDKVNVPANPFANQVVSIFGEVASPGTVEFPMTGNLDVATLVALAGNLTLQADAGRITVKRGTKIFSATLQAGAGVLQPGDIVTVPQSRFVGKFVTMTGQVGRPGPLAFPLDGKLDLLTAISSAGGFARLGNQKKVYLTRQVGSQNKTEVYNVLEMQEGRVPLVQLLPGDTINVPIRRF